MPLLKARTECLLRTSLLVHRSTRSRSTQVRARKWFVQQERKRSLWPRKVTTLKYVSHLAKYAASAWKQLRHLVSSVTYSIKTSRSVLLVATDARVFVQV